MDSYQLQLGFACVINIRHSAFRHARRVACGAPSAAVSPEYSSETSSERGRLLEVISLTGIGNPEIQNSLKTHGDIAGLGSIVDKRRGGDVVPGKGWALLGDAARTLKSTKKTTKQQVSQKSTKELQNGAQESPTIY